MYILYVNNIQIYRYQDKSYSKYQRQNSIIVYDLNIVSDTKVPIQRGICANEFQELIIFIQ